MKRAFVIFFLILSFLVSKTILAYAINVPSFGTCPNPTGNLIASYNDGIHGIVGDSETHTGSDYVYENEGSDTQCYCPVQGNDGIQTNWLNASNLSLTDIQNMEKLGWILIPNGAAWGLDNAPYLAINTSFTCPVLGSGGGNSGNTLGSSTSNDSGNPGTNNGQVLGASTTVLANTGYHIAERILIAFFITLGVFLIILI